jgi:hypothetical protein
MTPGVEEEKPAKGRNCYNTSLLVGKPSQIVFEKEGGKPLKINHSTWQYEEH